MSIERTQERSSNGSGGHEAFCVRQFAMLTFQEYSCRPSGTLAEDWLKERFGN